MPGRVLLSSVLLTLFTIPDANAETPRRAAALRRPITFETAADGASGVRYVAAADRYRLLATSRSLVVDGGSDRVALVFDGASQAARITPLDRPRGGTNYITGRDSTKWRLGVPGFGRIRYDNLYRNVDLVVYATDRDVEFDFVVLPGGRVGDIRMSLDGAKRVRVSDGELLIATTAGEMRLRRPVTYQTDTNGARRAVESRYVLSKAGAVTFEVGAYDRTQPLVIDPVVVYSSFFGGTTDEWSWSSQMVAVDASGSAYLTGFADDGHSGRRAFVSKIAPDGTSVIYTTFLYGTLPNGKNAGTDSRGNAIAVDAAGNAYVVGGNLARDFPVTAGTFTNPSHLMNEATMFLAKLRPDGSLEFSGIWGTDSYDNSADVVLDAAGNIYVAGQTCMSPDVFPAGALGAQPTTSCFPNAIRHPSTDAFVAKFNPAASAMVYFTYLGGGSIDQAYGVAVDSTGAAVVTGRTMSENFPCVAPVQAVRSGETDAFVTKINPNGSQFVYSTYLGGSAYDLGRQVAPNGVAVDGSGNAYVSGTTEADGLPVTAGAFRTERPPYSATFVTKFSPAGSIDYLTYVSSGVATGIAVDTAGRAHLVGSTSWGTLPVTIDAAQLTFGGSDDAFLAVLSADGSAVEYATYLGGPALEYTNGVAIGTNGSVYLAGLTLGAGGFPATANAFQPTYGGGGADMFIVRIQFTQPDTTAPSIGDVSDITVQTDSTSGAVVTFALPAVTDDFDPEPTVDASPASGSTFPLGSTTVTVTATDAAGNSSDKTFTVTVVLSPPAMIAALINESASFRQGSHLLGNAKRNVEVGDVAAACNQLNAFTNQVRAQRGKSIAAGQADAWMATAASIRNALGCR